VGDGGKEGEGEGSEAWREAQERLLDKGIRMSASPRTFHARSALRTSVCVLDALSLARARGLWPWDSE